MVRRAVVFAHAADAIIVRPAVVAIEIAFPLGEEVGNDGLKFAGGECET